MKRESLGAWREFNNQEALLQQSGIGLESNSGLGRQFASQKALAPAAE